MKTLNKFLSAALAVGLVVAPLAVAAEGTVGIAPTAAFERDAVSQIDCELANTPGHADFIEGFEWRWFTPEADEAVPEFIANPDWDEAGDVDPIGNPTHIVNPDFVDPTDADPVCWAFEVEAEEGAEEGDVRHPGSAVGANFRNAWNGGIATARAEREALNTAVAAARAAIAAGNDGVRGAATIPFNIGWTWANGAGVSQGDFFASNIGNDCSARLTALLDRYSDDALGNVVTGYLLSELLYIQDRYIAANLMTQQQFANALFVGNARIDHGRHVAAKLTTRQIPSEEFRDFPSVLFNTHTNGYALFNLNNASQNNNTFQEGSRYVVFAEGAIVQSFNFTFANNVARGGSGDARGAGFNVDVRTQVPGVGIIFSNESTMPTGSGLFTEAQFELELANFRTRAARYQIEEVLVRDCGVEVSAAAPSTTAPATTAPATTAPAGTTTGGGGAQLPQTNTAVVATGLAGVGVTGLGAVAAFLKNKKA